MTDPREFSLKNVAETLKNLAVLMAALTATISALAAIVVFIFGPRVEPWLDRIAKIDAIEKDLAAIANQTAAERRPFVEFKYNAEVFPRQAKPGDTIEIVYSIRRNRPCPTDVEIRFWSLERKSFDPRFIRVVPSVRSSVTNTLHLWTLPLTIPDGLPAGWWAYQPVMTPRGDCSHEETQQPPAAFFEVIG